MFAFDRLLDYNERPPSLSLMDHSVGARPAAVLHALFEITIGPIAAVGRKHARRRSTILGEIVGFGMSSGPREPGRGRHGARAVEGALADSRLWPQQDIQYANAHGSGTAANDASETKAIKRVFGTQASLLCPRTSRWSATLGRRRRARAGGDYDVGERGGRSADDELSRDPIPPVLKRGTRVAHRGGAVQFVLLRRPQRGSQCAVPITTRKPHLNL